MSEMSFLLGRWQGGNQPINRDSLLFLCQELDNLMLISQIAREDADITLNSAVLEWTEAAILGTSADKRQVNPSRECSDPRASAMRRKVEAPQ
jgi:hypothetical protein